MRRALLNILRAQDLHLAPLLQRARVAGTHALLLHWPPTPSATGRTATQPRLLLSRLHIRSFQSDRAVGL
eukprot:scaffold7375_cov268-Pinguiococcus_pyrenoidosus.AAC.49